MCKWSNAFFKRSWRWPSAVIDISTCLGYACFMHCKEAGAIVLLPFGITKVLHFHEWRLTITVLALMENAAIVRYAKYSFQQRSTRHGSQKPSQKYSFQLFNRTSLYWALWFEHNKCTNPDFNKSQRQYHFENTSRATFSFLCCWGKPTESTKVTGSMLSDSWSLNFHALSSAQKPNKYKTQSTSYK